MSYLEYACPGHEGQRRGDWSRDRWRRRDGRLDRHADQFASFLSRCGRTDWNDLAAVGHLAAGRSGEGGAAVAGTYGGGAARRATSAATSGDNASGESIHVLHAGNSWHAAHRDTGSAGTQWHPRAADHYSGNSGYAGGALSVSVVV